MNLSDMPEISRIVWDEKYRFKFGDGEPIDQTIDDTFKRVALAVSQSEPLDRQLFWTDRFFEIMSEGLFLPGGRVIAGAGTGRSVTLFNCFVMGTIKDDLRDIFANLSDAAMTMKAGGGIGHDFSTLRPAGAPVNGVGAHSSGALSFMNLWDSMCRTIMSAGARRGAMMGTMRDDHPDIEDFVDAKRDKSRLRMFNLSVLVSDCFMRAVRNDKPWRLQFGGRVYKTIQARDLWEKIMRATYDGAEPGVIFIDRVNNANALNYCETITCSNPCGEQMLPPHGACLLGSINLAKFVRAPFEQGACVSMGLLADTTRTAVRFLDNVIDVSNYPLAEQEAEAKSKRRIGLGVTGLADMLAMMGLSYGSPGSVSLTRAVMALIFQHATSASEQLGKEKGSFPLFDPEAYATRRHTPTHRRNGLLTSIAPTGTISLLAGNVSSGIEPIFDTVLTRKILQPDGTHKEVTLTDYAYGLLNGEAHLHEFPTAATLTPEDHLRIQAACQPFVDNSISKTINCPETITYEAFKDIYSQAYDLGCKSCTTYRPNAITGSILSSATMAECTGDRCA